MLKDIHNYNARAVAAGLLLALMTGTAFAQLLPTAPALGQSANGVEQIEAATPLTLQKAVALALEANLDLTVAQREIEAVEGQVIQGRVRPNPELAYSLEDQRMDDLPNVPSLDDIQQRLSASSALRRAQLEIERRRSLADVERSKQTPDVTVSLGVKRPNELARNQLMLGISVPLPLFDRNQGNLLEALKREDKARDELQALNLRLSTEVLQARERLASVRGEIDVLQREVLPGAKSAYDAATVGFGYGKFNFLEVLDAQRTYFAAKSQYLKALADAHRAAADMDRVIGASEPMTTPPANKE